MKNVYLNVKIKLNRFFKNCLIDIYSKNRIKLMITILNEDIRRVMKIIKLVTIIGKFHFI